MTKKLSILLITILSISCNAQKETFSNDYLIGEYSSSINGELEFVIKKDKKGYFIQLLIENGTNWSPRENLTEMNEQELEKELGPNWKNFTLSGLTSEVCNYFKISNNSEVNGISKGQQAKTKYFSRCFADNYFYKLETPKSRDTLKNTNDEILTSLFMKTLFNNKMNIYYRENEIENIISHLDNPNFEINGFTFLHETILSDLPKTTKLNIINMLISKGVDVNMPAGTYSTPPLFLVKDVETTRVLLENGADPNYISDIEQTMLSSYNITHDMLKLVKEYGFNFNFINSKGETLLHTATNYSSTYEKKELDFLIQQIPEYVNRYDDNGYAPIHYYARENFTSTLDMQIKTAH